MKVEKTNLTTKYIYHFTSKKNVQKILADKKIISKDSYVFFAKSLKDSITIFEREMMQEGKLYIDVDGHLRKREKCSKNDYCILQIPYVEDNNFYTFKFEGQSKDSVYTLSIAHKGEYHLKNAKVIEFPKAKKLNKVSAAVAVTIASGIMLCPYNVFASSWLENNNYDLNWYQETQSNYSIGTEKELAGLAYLVNFEGKTFENKTINITRDIDLTENTWQTIKDIFKGNICGGHRIILNLQSNKFAEESNRLNVKIEYAVSAYVDNKLKEVYLAAPYLVKDLKLNSTPFTAFYNNEILSDDTSIFDLDLSGNNKLEIFSRYNLVSDSNNVKIPFYTENGEAIDNLKRFYATKTGIPYEKLVFMYNGKELLDGRNLADYNILKEQVINALVKVNVTSTVEEGKGEVICSKEYALTNDKVIFTFKPDTNYLIDKVLVNGQDMTDKVITNTLEVECGMQDISVKVTYKQDKTKDVVQEEKTENTKTENPKTGDNSIVGYIITMLTSLFVLVTLGVKKCFKKD